MSEWFEELSVPGCSTSSVATFKVVDPNVDNVLDAWIRWIVLIAAKQTTSISVQSGTCNTLSSLSSNPSMSQLLLGFPSPIAYALVLTLESCSCGTHVFQVSIRKDL